MICVCVAGFGFGLWERESANNEFTGASFLCDKRSNY